MKLITTLAAVCLAVPAMGQGVRFDHRVATIATNYPEGAQVPVMAIPKAQVTICVDGNCGTKASIYSNQTLIVPTSNPMQADGQGNFGFWAAAGTYFYKVVEPSGKVDGPYPITLGGAGGGGGTGCNSFGTHTLQMSDGNGGCLTTNSDYNIGGNLSFDFGSQATPAGFNAFTGGLGFLVQSTTGGILLQDNSGGIHLSEGTGGIAISQNSGGISITQNSGGITIRDNADSVNIESAGSLVNISGQGVSVISGGTTSPTNDIIFKAQTNRYQFTKGSDFSQPTPHGDFDTSLFTPGDAFVYTMPRATGTLALKGTISSATAPLCANGTGGVLTDAGCTGGGGSGISGLTAGYVPLAGSSTTLTGNSHLNEVTNAGADTFTQPVIVNDGTGKAGAIQLLAGTAPSAAPTSTIQINAPTAVTAYSMKLPGAQGTGALTNDGAGNLSFVPSGGSGTVTSFAAPSGSWPAWLVPTVTNSTTAPSLAVAASAIPNAALASQTANTVLGALTATTPSGLALPSCSGATNALIWTTGTGFGCNTITGGGSGTVTSFSAGTLSPLFTTSVATATSTPALTFSLSTAGAHSFFGNATGSTAAPAYSLIGTNDWSPNAYIAGAGAVNVMTATLSPAATALVAGLEVDVLPNLANTTTTPTLNVNGLGAATITKNGTTALVAGDYSTTAIAKFIYDGTRWQLQNPQTSSGGSSGFPITIGSTPVAASSTTTAFSGITSLGLTSAAPLSWNSDTGISRGAANSLDVGNGTAGDVSGTINASTLVLGPSNGAGWTVQGARSSGPANIGVSSGAGTWAFLTVNSSGAPGFLWDSSHDFVLASTTAIGGTGFNPLFKVLATGNTIQNTGTVIGFGSVSAATIDAGISRLAASSFALGNGTAGDKSAKLSLAFLTGAGTVTIAPGASGQVGTGATAACVGGVPGYVCDSLSGTISLTTGTGTLTPGTIATVTFSIARSNNPSCTVNIEGGTTFLAGGHSATASVLTFTTGVAAAASTTYTLSYVCGGG